MRSVKRAPHLLARLRPRDARARRGLRGTAVAAAAVALLTASQAPSLIDRAATGRDGGGTRSPGPAAAPLPDVASQGDDSYHTELPPLNTPDAPTHLFPAAQIRAQAGVPATVLAAYRRAEAALARTDAGCRLPWELLAAIGKVESGQARGGAVDAHGTTLRRITGPALDGQGFALIRDSDGGAWDGDTVYDRAVGPLQFLPSTWRRWGADGNGDGDRNPNNIFDAALAAGHYLCAGDRDVSRAAGRERAILSYNYSRDYLRLVLYWMEFYREGVHTVPDGKGVLPKSPGAGGDTPATRPVGGGRGPGKGPGNGSGIVVGPDPTPSGPHGGGSNPHPSPDPSPDPNPGPGPGGDPADPSSPSPGPSDPPVTQDPGTPTGPGNPEPSADCPTGTASPSPGPDPSAGPGESPPATPSPDPSTSGCPAPGA
ncbi:lytic transglycosylase domain-containing protein [Streptomyces antnestii]|uniref:lytic transglycosylase domain-containing protein n=1 Tax=Streptomyces antnestii TaxID=2494256 RepID=UPI001CB940A5|nr:lytic murein transglycosylase [Streptomyces sp. San01]